LRRAPVTPRQPVFPCVHAVPPQHTWCGVAAAPPRV